MLVEDDTDRKKISLLASKQNSVYLVVSFVYLHEISSSLSTNFMKLRILQDL